MAYLRQKGNQLAIVHGVRDSETRKVEQRTLFTFYSKAEALAALGRSEAGKGINFRGLVERANPGIRFQWNNIFARLERNMDVLPDLWDYREARLEKSFREAVVTFTRELLRADPQNRISSARLLAANRAELEYLRRLIDWRLRMSDQKENDWNRDTPFFWFHALPMEHLHPDEEEHAEKLYLERRYDEAQALFKLFIECYPRYADGYNYLGAICEERDELEGAIALYETAIEIGRSLFPKRIGKKHYWTDLDTRPYMRGLRNLTGALNCAARYDEALELCDRQETECGDEISAGWFRGEIYLNLARWDEAYRWTRYTTGLWADRNVLTAFAAHALGRESEAASRFLCGLLNSPRAARMVVGLGPRSDPKTPDDVRSHNTGVGWLRALHHYIRTRPESSRLFFSRIARHPHTRALESQLNKAIKIWHSRDPQTSCPGHTTMTEMKSLPFAQSEIKKIIS